MEYLGLLFSIVLFIFASTGYLPPVILVLSIILGAFCLYKIVFNKNQQSLTDYNPTFWDGIIIADVLDSDWSGDSE